MKPNAYKSRSSKESIDIKNVHKPIVGKYKLVDGKWIFVEQVFKWV